MGCFDAPITRQTVQFNPQAIETDLLQFRRLLPTDPQAAIALYQGDFLQGLTLPDASPFNEWRTLEQERLHHQMTQALDHLLALAEAEEQWEQAREVAARQLRDPGKCCAVTGELDDTVAAAESLR